MRTHAFHARSMITFVLNGTCFNDPTLLSVIGFDMSCSAHVCAALWGRSPQRGRSGSNVQFERRSEAEWAQVQRLFRRPMRFRSGLERQKRGRAANSSAPVEPKQDRGDPEGISMVVCRVDPMRIRCRRLHDQHWFCPCLDM